MQWPNFITRLTEFLTRHSSEIVRGILILIAGLTIARVVGNVVQRWLNRKDLEPPLRTLVVRVVRLIVIVFTLVLVLDQCGVPTAPLVAGIGVVGVGIGLASQGVLSNLFAGLLIIFTKPFRVGEYVSVLAVEGQVENIDLFSTVLAHADRSRVVIPNRKIIGEILHNYGTIRQLDLWVGVSYDTELSRAQSLIHEILQESPRVLKTPAPAIGISGLEDSSIAIAVKPWVSVNDFGVASGELYQRIIERFRTSGLSMPFPQREIRIVKDSSDWGTLTRKADVHPKVHD